MKFQHLILFICFLPSVLCEQAKCHVERIIFGVVILTMGITIIILSIALFLLKNKKSVIKITNNEKPSLFRQESGTVISLRNVTSGNNLVDNCKQNGSTLTINSGIVEIGRVSEIQTPLEEENKILFFRKPTMPIVNALRKSEMDDIIKGVLKRKQKSYSATIKEIDALAKQNTANVSKCDNSEKASLKELRGFSNNDINESLYGNVLTIDYLKKHNDIKDEGINLRQNQFNHSSLTKLPNDVELHVNKVKMSVNEEDKKESYYTLPNPNRDSTVDALKIYDLPANIIWTKENHTVVLDQDTQYLLPISENEQSGDFSCYVNAINQDRAK